MNVLETTQVAEILERVKNWPPEPKILLARRILETLDSGDSAARARRGRSVRELIGIGAGDSPPAGDQTVRRWIDEHRAEKHG